MDAPCEIQGSIHVFRLVNNMCPGKWVHITNASLFLFAQIAYTPLFYMKIEIIIFYSVQIYRILYN